MSIGTPLRTVQRPYSVMGDPLDIIVVGAGRAASTSIASYLGQHPDIVLSEPKEAHFFDIYYDEGIHAIPPMYFGHRTTETLAVEATPDYLTLPWVPDRIAASLPQVKLVATLRNPVDRAWSQWWLLYTRGIEDLPFEDAIAANLARIESGEPLDELKWAEHVAIRSQGIGQVYRLYLDHGYYAKNLARYFEHFDRDAMFVVFTDELKEEPEKTVRSLYRFVGADDSVGVEVTSTNEAAGAGARPLMKSARAVGLTRLAPHLPDAFKQRIKFRLAKLGGRPQMPPNVRRELEAHFAPHNRALEELLGVDLSRW